MCCVNSSTQAIEVSCSESSRRDVWQCQDTARLGKGLQAVTSPKVPTIPERGEHSWLWLLWTDLLSSPGQGLSLKMALKPWAETPAEVSHRYFSLKADDSSCCCATSELALSRSEPLGRGQEESTTLTVRI